MTLAEAIAQLERRRAWIEARMALGRCELGDRVEVNALDVALPVLREQLANTVVEEAHAA